MIKLKIQDLILGSLTNSADNHLFQLHMQSMNSALVSDWTFKLSWSLASSSVPMNSGKYSEKYWQTVCKTISKPWTQSFALSRDGTSTP